MIVMRVTTPCDPRAPRLVVRHVGTEYVVASHCATLGRFESLGAAQDFAVMWPRRNNASKEHRDMTLRTETLTTEIYDRIQTLSLTVKELEAADNYLDAAQQCQAIAGISMQLSQLFEVLWEGIENAKSEQEYPTAFHPSERKAGQGGGVY